MGEIVVPVLTILCILYTIFDAIEFSPTIIAICSPKTALYQLTDDPTIFLLWMLPGRSLVGFKVLADLVLQIGSIKLAHGEDSILFMQF
jgi:hypothetical protein